MDSSVITNKTSLETGRAETKGLLDRCIKVPLPDSPAGGGEDIVEVDCIGVACRSTSAQGTSTGSGSTGSA
jgi:hypothetical protein